MDSTVSGFAPRASRYFIIISMFMIQAAAQIPPGAPSITGPQVIIKGDQVTLTCTVNGGSPTPTVKWLRDDVVVDDSSTTSGTTVVNTYSFTASNDEHLEVFECQSENGVLQNPLSRTKFVEVYRPPITPVLVGPDETQPGTLTTWTCTSRGGYPLQTMAMRIGNSVFSNELTTNSVLVNESYTVTGTLSWAPTTANNGQTLFCDVYHPETLGQNNPQTVSKILTVRSPLAVNAPRTLYEPTTGQTITLTCQVTSGTATSIMWYKDNQLLNLAANSRLSGASPGAPSMTISNVQTSDTGNYICSATDGSATRNTSTITVSPRATPTQPTLVGPTSMTAGSTGTWTCTSIGGFPLQTMSMRINNVVVNSNELSINSQYNSNLRTYTVVGTLNKALNMGHNGQTLFCDVTHPETLQSPQTVSLPLTVRSPLAVTAPTTFYNPEEEEDVTLNCIVTTGTATGINWYKNNNRITVGANQRFSGGLPNSPSLTMTDVEIADGGNYICEATDGSATVRTNSIFVSVRERPWLEYDIITYVLDGYNKLVRPRDPVVNVTHSLIPREIFEFDGGKKFVLQAMQCMSWNDPRLTWPKGQPRISLPSSVIWLPDVVLFGQKYVPDFEAKVIVTKDGTVVYCPQGPITATNCEEKSGEVYECDFRFLSWSYDKVMLDKHFPGLISDPSIDMSIYLEHDHYEIVSRCAVRREMTYPCRDGTYPELKYTFVLRRRRSFCRNLNQSPTCV